METDASLTPPQEGQPSPTSTESRSADQLLSDAASASGQAGTPDKPASYNLHQDENFKRVQASYEKRIAEQAKRLAELEAAREEAELADMDDVDRLRYEKNKLAAQLQERQQAEVIEQQKRTILSELSAKSGVPMDVLSEAESAYDAALLAVEYLRRGDKKEASKVDLGGGRASTPADRIETAAREAFQAGDAAAYVRLLREAQAT
jgi:hypothetical protein